MNGRAGGKAILLGEHTVVHGGAAVAVPISGLQVEVTLFPGGGWSLDPPQDSGTAELDRALDAMLQQAGWTGARPGVQVRATLPMACGLGSSAAFAVALARAILDRGEGKEDGDAVRALADSAERVFHGNPSGVDVATVMAGSPIRFRRGETPAPVPVGGRFDLWVVDSGIRSSTAEVVGDVTALRRRDPDLFGAAFQGIDDAVAAGIDALASGSLSDLAAAMDAAMAGLRSLDVSHPRVEQVLEAAHTAGAAAGKISGAGRGGIVLLLGPDLKWDPGPSIVGAPVLTRVLLMGS